MSDPAIRFRCPACGKEVRAQAAQAGTRVKCPRRGCGAVIRVPGAPMPVIEPVPAPSSGAAWLLAGAIGLVVVLVAAVGLVWYVNRPSGAAQGGHAQGKATPAGERAEERQAAPVDTVPSRPMPPAPAVVAIQPEEPMAAPPEPEAPKKAAPPKAPAANPASGARLSELTITKTTFEPPSVEFTVRLDLAGGKLLEAWASVGVPDAGKTLQSFAGALYKGVLAVNGINFAKPDPALKAQRVSMKKSAEDDSLYVCTVRYPKLVLDDPETEFTMVAAVDKDKEILNTNAVTARVNLNTGKVASARNAKAPPTAEPAPDARVAAAFAGKWTGVERYNGALLTILPTIDDQGQARYQRTLLQGTKIEADTRDRSSKLVTEGDAVSIKLLEATYRCELRGGRNEMTLIAGAGPKTFSFGRPEK